MSHLTADELVDAAEGTLNLARVAHVANCAICRREAERLATAFGAATEADIPEPSPLFWEQLSARVHHAIAAEETAPRRWAPAWLAWPVVAPIAALAMIVIALAAAVTRGPATTVPSNAEPAAVVATRDLDTLGEEEWAVVSEIVGSVDFEQAREVGIVVKPGDVEEAALELTAAEQQVLVDLVKAASERPGV
jgi:hypothetical protein